MILNFFCRLLSGQRALALQGLQMFTVFFLERNGHEHSSSFTMFSNSQQWHSSLIPEKYQVFSNTLGWKILPGVFLVVSN